MCVHVCVCACVYMCVCACVFLFVCFPAVPFSPTPTHAHSLCVCCALYAWVHGCAIARVEHKVKQGSAAQRLHDASEASKYVVVIVGGGCGRKIRIGDMEIALVLISLGFPQCLVLGSLLLCHSYLGVKHLMASWDSSTRSSPSAPWFVCACVYVRVLVHVCVWSYVCVCLCVLVRVCVRVCLPLCASLCLSLPRWNQRMRIACSCHADKIKDGLGPVQSGETRGCAAHEASKVST